MTATGGLKMKQAWIAFAAASTITTGAHAALDKSAAEALMKKDGCAGCHEVDKKLIGPAFQDVAAKYRNDKDAAVKLREKVKKGGTHVWGEAAMPPNVLASDADVNELVDWILTLNK
jgi:cytochrome c